MDAIAQRLSTRGFVLPVEQFRELDARRRAAITETEELRRDQNNQSREIARLRKEGADTTDLQLQSREIGERIAALAKLSPKPWMLAIASCSPVFPTSRTNLFPKGVPPTTMS